MPNVYVPSPVPLVNVTEPIDGELRSVAGVTTMTRAIANGLSYENFLRTPLANLAALIAILVPTDGAMRFVRGQGVFIFDSAASAGLSPFAIAAGDATPGAWVSATAHETSRLVMGHPAYLPNYQTISTQAPGVGPQGKPSGATDIVFTNGGMQFITVVTGSSTAHAIIVALNPLLIDGATLALVRLRWKPNPTHVALPVLMPKATITRVNFNQTSLGPLISTGGGLVTDPSTPFANYNLEHDFDIAPDQFNVIDRTTYGYHLIVWNEGGANSLSNSGFYSMAITQTAIPDGRRA